MRTNTLVIVLVSLLFACNSLKEKNFASTESNERTALVSNNEESERLIPDTKETLQFDTILLDRNVQVSIKRTDLDSYVIHEYEVNGKKHFDKYRDAEIKLIIKQDSQILIDTIFRKEQFTKYADVGFMDISIFHNYWFNKSDKDKIELFGVITKPETDYVLTFNHYFDLINKRLSFVEYAEDEE